MAKMTLYEFSILEERLQLQTVWEIGKHLGTVTEGKATCLLYAVNAFYVEVRYCLRTNQILGWLPFKQGEYLDKYLPNLAAW